MTLTAIYDAEKNVLIEQPGVEKIRRAIADYMCSEGCSCCRDSKAHEEAEARLAKLLNVKKYEDGSGYDFYSYSANK